MPLAEYESSRHHADFGNHIYETAFEKTGDTSQLVPTCGPDWDAIEQAVSGKEPASDDKSEISFAQASALLCRMLDFFLLSRSLSEVGARVAAVDLWIRPHMSSYKSYTEIAKDCGISKAAVSKWICTFYDQVGGHLPPPSNKRLGAREVYRRAQFSAIRAGTHSSCKPTRQGDKRRGKRKPSIAKRTCAAKR